MNPASNTNTDRARINGLNAQHSTGPRTGAGKQRSSLNALRHGLSGHVVLPTEDQAAYQRHLKRFVDQFQPKGALEEQLVQSLGDSTWRLNRVPATEATYRTIASEDLLDSIHTNEPRAASALAMAQDGFVFSTAEIQFIQRRDRLNEAYCEPERHLAAAS